MNHYCRTSAVASRFDPNRLFVTEGEARAHDRGFAAQFIAGLDSVKVLAALKGERYEQLRRVVDFLNEELPRDVGSV